MVETEEKPAFEVRSGGEVYRIWANGKVEGFEEPTFVINRIPTLAYGKSASETAGTTASCGCHTMGLGYCPTHQPHLADQARLKSV